MPTKQFMNYIDARKHCYTHGMLGIFDSGSGGLTVLRAIRDVFPKAGIIYFGDIANAPFGEKSPEELLSLTHTGTAILEKAGTTMLVSACNSVSMSVLAGAAGTLPYIEMSRPTAHYLAEQPGTRLLLLATPATIVSGIYEKALRDIVSLDALALPGLAGAIEFAAPDAELEHILVGALAEKKNTPYDRVLLGCTHYPLIRPLIERTIEHQFGAPIPIIDPAYPVAQAVRRRWPTLPEGPMRFMSSAPSSTFTERIHTLFPDEHCRIEVIGEH